MLSGLGLVVSGVGQVECRTLSICLASLWSLKLLHYLLDRSYGFRITAFLLQQHTRRVLHGKVLLIFLEQTNLPSYSSTVHVLHERVLIFLKTINSPPLNRCVNHFISIFVHYLCLLIRAMKNLLLTKMNLLNNPFWMIILWMWEITKII